MKVVPSREHDVRDIPTAILRAELDRRERHARPVERQRWSCQTCGQVFTAGDAGRILFVDHGRYWCYRCTDVFRAMPRFHGWLSIDVEVAQIREGYGEMHACGTVASGQEKR